jgi:membrane AbrB-like protein
MPDAGTSQANGGSGFPGRPVLRTGLALMIGLVGALLANLANMPLPFLLGPLMLCGLAAVSGIGISPLPYGREAGQIVVGLAIGLRFVPDVALATARLIPVMVVATVLIMSATTIAAFMLERLGGVDRKTAFFATSAAGLAEMAVVANQKNADSETVAVVHLVRVTVIVTTIPFLVTIFGSDGGIATTQIAFASEAIALVALLIAAAIAALAISRFKIPNSWLFVPALIGAVVAGFGFGPFAVPPIFLTVAQILIGTWIGCRFRRQILARLPRVTISAVATTAFLIFAAAAIAGLLTLITDLSFTTSLLAVAPAGVTEMVLTATAMHLDAATVTAFQIMRIAIVMTTIPITLKGFELLSRRIDGKIL